MVRANPRGFSGVLAAAWGLTWARRRRGCAGGHEHDDDCVVPLAVARVLSPRATLKQVDELELARDPPHTLRPHSSSNVILFAGAPARAVLIVTHHRGGRGDRRP
jgi:hypothetical protein